MERTLTIIKPDAVERNLVGTILAAVEAGGLKIVGLKMTGLTDKTAGDFYQVHRGKDFFEKLAAYMSSGPIVVAVVEGDDAIARLRSICGATDPAAAAPGTIRASHGVNLTMNSVHASDSVASARYEIGFFFPEMVPCY
ncbi:MAG: nucleoside-diphosphate kinase [bacterium]